ncbi:glutamate decarboxylase [Enterococcus quebecensis]|uniref:Glutamate decarboxylase n=1 Tax=Enterococcus quebecensis TaxID=903983 RepID=A0A1E5GS70_9ENTE|nr:glutamate decarboxylase [Enterococcus quebecensis]OEG15558.1 glutamate decarboxylase [Enterococcus quebecensis]OJG74658.1 glutamate decarboxylase [Enterococcus quebecensis]
MIHKKRRHEDNDYLEPIFGTKAEGQILPNYRLAQQPIEPRIAHQLVKDELLDEGSARQNLATFCQTFMEPEAIDLMANTLEKNAIDKSEYPQVTELENRCVNMIADLWHANDSEDYLGTSTIGSSEACMLAGMAMKFAWRNRVQKLGLDSTKKKPNLVISSGYQVCWEKFGVYWDVELREVPIEQAEMTLNLKSVMDYVDEYTIGIVGILGITYTGKYDDIEQLNNLVEQYNQTTDYKVFIHVDGASGGLFTPFVDPELIWDFRLNNVVSINTSGHKYGLVYPGVGWVIWRGKKYLPEELIFEVSYLGGTMPTMAINFSHSASHIIGQYYNFLRFGFEGYQAIHQKTRLVAKFLGKKLTTFGDFDVINDGNDLPVICYSLKKDKNIHWTLYDLSDRLRMKGWQVPTYPLPKNMDDVLVQRIVVREDFGMNLAHDFIKDLQSALNELNQAHILFHDDDGLQSYGFTH